MDIFDNINPLDFRYYGRDKAVFDKLNPYLSEKAMIRYICKVEAALTRVLAKRKICSKKIADEVEDACKKITAEEVYNEEDRIKHNIRALVNCIRNKVSDGAKPFVHFTTTSHDIINTAESLRLKDVCLNIVVPDLTEFEKTLIDIAKREKDTLQIGRTHGQHAEPITFGFAIAEYVSRTGKCILEIKKAAENLRGKISGAVGAYNASSLFFNDPEEFEKDVLAELKMKPADHSTQIVEPEYVLNLMHYVVTAFGVLANLADDMRHLQRTEISEVGEGFGEEQVGSSTMPHKRNPINFENVKSMWKAIMPRLTTCYLDQISEHQRDLTNSASSRFMVEIIAAFAASVKRMNKIMKKLVVDRINLTKNFEQSKEMVIAEPLYILLAAHNHPDAHECVRKLTLESQKTGKPLRELVLNNKNLKPYLDKFTKEQKEVLKNPEKYIGIAAKKAEKICRKWGIELEI